VNPSRYTNLVLSGDAGSFKMPWKDKKVRNAREKWRKETRRNAWLNENGPCVYCGGCDTLEVDHINPETKVSHRIWLWGDKRREDELSKCQVLCRKCHLEKSRKELISRPDHGTNNRYTSKLHRCRCNLCKDAHRRYNAEYKK